MKTPRFAILSWALLSLYLLAAQVEGIPAPGALLVSRVPRESDSYRSHCHTRASSCEFYSNCIESDFHCGSQGFTVSYAQERCNIIKKLRPGSCTSQFCVSRQARNWAHHTESCIRNKLMNLLNNHTYTANKHPDPHSCLAWEMDAIAQLNSCYLERGSAFLNLPEADMHALVNLFRISDYYSPAVSAGLVDLIETRNPVLAMALYSNHTLSSRHRIVLCVKGTKYTVGASGTSPSPQDYVTVASQALAPEETEFFHYAGPDQLEDTVGGLCYNRSSDYNINTYVNDYHLVTWFTADHNRDDIGKVDIRHKNEIEGFGVLEVSGVLFELTTTIQPNTPYPERKITQCGDGIRQVTELCDFTAAYPGCTIDCRVREEHDCTTEKMAGSRCWREVCGDGLRTRGEQCDDGNTSAEEEDVDGCSNSCRIDSDTHSCSQAYNDTSKCKPLVSSLSQLPAQPANSRLTAGGSLNPRRAPSASSEDITLLLLPAASAGFRLMATSVLPAILAVASVLGMR